MIVVTGATGALNGATVEHLLGRVSPHRIGVSVRDPAKAQHFADRGVRVRRGSYEDPAALLDSFEGADQVLLVSSNDFAADQDTLHRTAIAIAVRAGARRILYTSHQNADPSSPFAAAPHHAAAEAALTDSGVAWTSLRNGFYAHSLDWLLGPWQETGVIAAPADGPVSWTDRADAAEAAAVILAANETCDETRNKTGTKTSDQTSDQTSDKAGDQTSDKAGGETGNEAGDDTGDQAGDEAFEGPLTLTASAAVTFDDIAWIASDVTGREVRRIVIGDEEWVAAQIERGTPEGVARVLLGFFQAARRGDFAESDPALAKLLGREPRTVRDLIQDRVAG
ncbi:NAD(P)H-binding protein [Actinoplanes sp. NPDC023714]|uniref:NAD(P)H-binding protein n=1 Tax=Actinoplanes sp. NPDC023714 TaxID=3154322 RepID=UPI0033CD53EF